MPSPRKTIKKEEEKSIHDALVTDESPATHVA